MTQSNKDKAPIDRESILKVCREWKWYWQQQEERYKITAFGIDANMIHHVADKVWEHVQPLLTSSTEREQELVRKLEKARELFEDNFDPQFFNLDNYEDELNQLAKELK